MADPRKLRILLADDHETVREGLKAILNAQTDMVVVAEASDGADAITQATALRPDIVLMDISMPRVHGSHATEALASCCPEVKVIALTRHSDGGHLATLLRAGVAGYVLKQSRSGELLTAIRAVARGGHYLDPAVTGTVMDAAGRRARPPLRADVPLSPREEQVLRMMAWGYSNKEIATDLTLSVKTVETHKANAMAKLGLNGRIDVVRFAVLRGWLQDA